MERIKSINGYGRYVFSIFQNIDNYSAYLIIGQTLFTFMTEATNQAIFSITGNGPLLKKVYVPKYVFTLSKVTSSLVNLVFSLGAMIIVFVITKVQFSWAMLFFPVILMEVYIFSLGLGLFLAEAAVFFRDIQYIYNVLTFIWGYYSSVDVFDTYFLSDGTVTGISAESN